MKRSIVSAPAFIPTEPAAPAPAAPAAPAPPAAPVVPPAAPAAPAAPPAPPPTPAPVPAAPAAPAAPAPPTTYALKAPEGGRVDAEDLTAFAAVAKANELSAEDAQLLVDEHNDALNAQAAKFEAEMTANPTYGGAALPETQKHATATLNRFAPAGDPLGDALRRDLVKSGYGSKLSVVSFLARIGKAMAEDTPVHAPSGGQVPAGGITDPGEQAKKLYPTMK